MGAPFKQNPDVNWVTDKEGTVLGHTNEIGLFVPLADVDSVSNGFGPVVDIRDWSGFDNTGYNSMLSNIQAAQIALESYGKGRLELPRGTYAMDGNLLIKGGSPTLNGGYQGGTELVGQNMVDTVLNFSSGGIIIDVGVAPTHGSNSAMSMVSIENIKILGPGKNIADSVGIDCSPQGVWQSTPNAISIRKVWLDNFEQLSRFEDVTNLWITYCYLLNYKKGIRFGYNQDTVSVLWNRFGDNQIAIGSQEEIAIAWDFISPRFGSGGVVGTVGVAPNATATLAGAQNHAIKYNWFMRQELIADIADPSASNVSFEHNQFESCKHYAQLGTTSSGSVPNRIEFKQNVFMRTDGQEQTQAMFLFKNTAGGGSLSLIRNVCDSVTGPKYGWVQCGSTSTIEFSGNSLTVSGGYVLEANHLIVGSTGKKIVIPTNGSYTFIGSGGVGSTIEKQSNFSGRDNIPDVANWGYNASQSSSIFQRWQSKGASTDAVSGAALDVKSLTVNGQRFVTVNGMLQPYSNATLPSLGSDGSVIRSGFAFVPGSTGVADTLYCCMKSAADTYSWKLVATG